MATRNEQHLPARKGTVLPARRQCFKALNSHPEQGRLPFIFPEFLTRNCHLLSYVTRGTLSGQIYDRCYGSIVLGLRSLRTAERDSEREPVTVVKRVM